MTDEIFFDGVRHLSANDAALSSGFTRDYIGRLCRDGKLRGRRVGKNWYIDGDSFKSFLVTQEYAKSRRKEELAKERVQEYRAAGAVLGRRQEPTPVILPKKEFSRTAYVIPTVVPVVSNALAQRGNEIRAKLQKALETPSSPVAKGYESLTHVPSGFASAALQAVHVPSYTITPFMEFVHKLVALTLTFALVVGTYAAVDPQYAHFAAQSAQDELAAALDSYQHVTGGGVNELAQRTQSQVAAVAENPQLAASAVADTFTSSLPNIAGNIARALNTGVNNFVYAIAFPAKLVQSAGIAGGTGNGSVAVEVLPYQQPTTTLVATSSAIAQSAGAHTTINQPVVERVLTTERIVTAGGITEAQLDAKLNQLSNKLSSQMYSISSSASTPPASGGVINNIALTQRLDQISGTHITNSTFSGAISNSSIDATSLNVSGTASVSGETTLASTTINGSLNVNGAVQLTNISLASSTLSITGQSSQTSNLIQVKDASGTILFAVQPDGTLLTTNASSTQVYTSLLVAGGATTTTLHTDYLSAVTASTTNFSSFYGTTTNAVFVNATSTNLFATNASTTNLIFRNATGTNAFITNATTTNFFSTTASSTNLFAQTATLGVLSAGTLTLSSLSGLLQGNGSSAVTAVTGTAGQFPYYNGSNTLLATSSVFLSTAGQLGIGTTTPSANLSLSAGTAQLGAGIKKLQTFYGLGYDPSNSLLAFPVGASIGLGETYDPNTGNPMYGGALTFSSRYTDPTSLSEVAHYVFKGDSASQSLASHDIEFYDGALIMHGGSISTNNGTINTGTGSITSANVITNGSATSTFGSGGFTINTNKFVVQQGSGNVGIGTTSPATTFSIAGSQYLTGGLGVGIATTSSGALQTSGNATIGGNLSVLGTQFTLGPASSPVLTTSADGRLAVNTTVQDDLFAIKSNGTQHTFEIYGTGNQSRFLVNRDDLVGIWNETPTYTLDVTGNGHFTSLVDAANFVATSSSATTLLNGKLTVNNDTTLANATTSNLFSTTASSTNLFSQTATLGALTANSVAIPSTSNVLLYANGSNQVVGVTVGSSLTFSAGNLSLNIANPNTWTGLQQFANSTSTLFSATQKAYFGTSGQSSFDFSGALTLGTPLGQSSGGTGINSYTAGDILYADNSGNLQKLPVGGTGTVLKVQAGLPAWGTDLTTSGGSGTNSLWATTTNNLLIYPTDTSKVVAIGASSTSTLNSIFEVAGQQYISSKLGIATTSPSAAQLSVTGSGYFTGGLGVGVLNTSAGTFQTSGNATIGGTLLLPGLSTNSLLYNNGFNQVAAASVGASLTFSAGALSLNTANPNTWSALQTFSNASSTSFSNIGSAYFGATATSTFNSAGALTLASALGIASGGTATTTQVTNGVNYFDGTRITSSASLLSFTGSNFGIGSSTPSGKLAITAASASTYNNPLIAFEDPNRTVFGVLSAINPAGNQNGAYLGTRYNDQPLMFGAHDSEIMRITNVGGSSPRVGIGTTTPGAAFSVEGNSLLGNSATAGFFTATTTLASKFPNASSTLFSNIGTAYFGATATTTIDSAGRVNAQKLSLPSGSNFFFAGTASDLSNSTFMTGSLNRATFGSCSNSDCSGQQYFADFNYGGSLTSLYTKLALNTGGSVGAPALYLSTDNTSGLFRPTTDTIGVSTAGVERLRISSSGSVGVGTSTPWGQLAVSTPAQQSGSIPLFNIASTTNASLFNVLGSGNVGIGTSTPSSFFSIASASSNLGPELTNAGTWTSTNWTGTQGTGFTHTIGNTSALVDTFTVTPGAVYQVSFTLSARTAGRCAWTIGGVTFVNTTNNGSFSFIVSASNSNNLTCTPQSTFDGTFSSISVKQVSLLTAPVTLFDTTGAPSLQLYSPTASLLSTYVGLNAGGYGVSAGVSAFGTYALNLNASGSNNSAFGTYALSWNTSGGENSAFGYQALASSTTGSNNSAFGSGAMASSSANFDSAFGRQALMVDSGGSNNAFGYLALKNNTTATGNSAFGHQALTSITTGSSNTAMGSGSMTSATTTASDTAVGYSALQSDISTGQNIGVGAFALQRNTYGTSNSALGYAALNFTTTGTDNVAMGWRASENNQSATSTVAIGSGAARGNGSLYNNQGGVAIGAFTGSSLQTGSDYNTLLGYQAGYNITTGSNNLLLSNSTSSSAISNLTTGSQNILIGNNISLPSATANGQLNIGNILFGTGITGTGSTLSTGSIGIGTTTPWGALAISTSVQQDGTIPLLNIASTTNASLFSVFGNGNVGVGTTTPGALFSVGGNILGSGTLALAGTSGTTTIAAGQGFTIGGSQFVLQQGSGSVGVGTSTPSAKFSIQGTAGSGQIIDVASSTGASLLHLTAAGNLGIGTTTPQAKLEVTDSSAASTTPLYLTNFGFATSSTKVSLAFRTDDVNHTTGTTTATISSILQQNFGAGKGDLVFATLNAGAVTEAMRVTAGGFLGIGTTSPNSKLSVSQTSATPQVSLAYDLTHDFEMRVDSAGGLNAHASNNNIYMVNDNLWVCTGGSNTSNACPSGTPTGQGNLIVANKVGIGTTTPSDSLSVMTSMNVTSGAASGNLRFISQSSTNQIQSGTSTATVSGVMAPLQFTSIGGVTEFMRLDGTGNLLLGTTTSQVTGETIQNKLYIANGYPAGAGLATSTIIGDLKVTGKLDVPTIDPVYTVDGIKYATYGDSTIGVHEEILNTIQLTDKDPSTGKYAYTISFDTLDQGSDLWLFYQITDFGSAWKSLVISLTPSFDGKVFYKKVPGEHKLVIIGDEPGEVSMRLSGNRFDWSKWPTLRPDQEDKSYKGFELTSKPTISQAAAASVTQ